MRRTEALGRPSSRCLFIKDIFKIFKTVCWLISRLEAKCLQAFCRLTSAWLIHATPSCRNRFHYLNRGNEVHNSFHLLQYAAANEQAASSAIHWSANLWFFRMHGGIPQARSCATSFESSELVVLQVFVNGIRSSTYRRPLRRIFSLQIPSCLIFIK